MNKNPYKEQGLLTKNEAAKIAGCHPNTVYNKCIRGEVPFEFIDGVHYVTEEIAKLIGEEVRKFKEEQTALVARREEIRKRVREAKYNELPGATNIKRLTGGNENE